MQGRILDNTEGLREFINQTGRLFWNFQAKVDNSHQSVFPVCIIYLFDLRVGGVVTVCDVSEVRRFVSEGRSCNRSIQNRIDQ